MFMCVGVYVCMCLRARDWTHHTEQHQPVSHKVIKFHKSPSIKRLFDIELLNKKLLIVV